MLDQVITASIVLFHNKKEDLQKVIGSFLGHKGNVNLILVDNSSNDELSSLANDPRINYIFNNSNLGFGKAHNIALNQAFNLNSDYHIFLNPDIYFSPVIISIILQRFENEESIGLISPKILYKNNEVQFLCKLLPTPIDLIIRRFISIGNIRQKLINKYEMRFFGYDKEIEPPTVSGCFMFIKTSVIKKVGGFDERFFMYLEDVDLSRRIAQVSKVLFYPKVHITHKYEKGSYKQLRLLLYHLSSAIKYFNKWGWVFDKERKLINIQILNQLNY
jgi:GT2 family glycosyltransferase